MPEPSQVSPLAEEADEAARQEAILQIQRKRHFHVELTFGILIIAVVVVIWATTEYNNAGGWPTQGFSQSSSIHDVWNIWIVYPVGAIVVLLSGRAWWVYRGQRPITEEDIERELGRRAGGR